MKTESNKKRSSNIELLRIVAMLLIVSYHVILHLDIDTSTISIIPNRILINFLMFNGKFGVNLFMLISGYFLINAKFKLKNALKLFINTSICAIAILALLFFLKVPIGITDYIQNIFPMFFNVYWFITTYFVIYLLINYINRFLQNLPQKKYFILLIILGIVLSVLPSFFHIVMVNNNNFVWLIYLYFIGAYIKLYIPIKNKSAKYIVIGVFIYGLGVLSAFVFQYLGTKYTIFLEQQFYFAKQFSIFLLLASIFIFLGFLGLNTKISTKINTIASGMIGVYLIHDNYLLRKYLYFDVFQNNLFVNSPYFGLRILLTIILIFICSTILTLLYKQTIGKCVDKGCQILEEKIMNSKSLKNINKKFNKIGGLEEIK